MSINWNKIIPRWSGDVIEPPEAKKDVGYIAGDKPPAKWENWLRKGTYEALDETRDVIENIDSQLAHYAEFKEDITSFKTIKLNKDAEGIFTTVEHRRSDDTLISKSVLSGGTSPLYTTRTITYYELDGTTVKNTFARTLTYDVDGVLVSEV